MYNVIISVLLQLNCTTVIPPQALPTNGDGLWQTGQCQWIKVPCPKKSVFYTPVNTLRLPAGCKVYAPKIGYPVSVDAEVRSDLSAAGTLISDLQTELKICRGSGDESLMTLTHQLRRTNDGLKSCYDLNELQFHVVHKLESQVFWTRVFAVMGVTAATVLGIYVF